MNKLLTAAAAAGVIIAAAACSTGNETATETDYAAYVNPFIGAADNGHTFPGATTPFGMIQTSPVTGAVGWRYCSEYVYSDSVIWGFTQTHLNGTGCMDLGDILVMPSDGSRRRDWDQYRSPFDKSTESASPGYYAVTLSAPDVRAELTATPTPPFTATPTTEPTRRPAYRSAARSAWSEAQYHSHVRLCETQWEDSVTLTGHVLNSVWASQDYFFVMQFDHPVSDITTLAPATDTERGQRIVAGFDLRPGEQLMMKVALSTTSVDGARRNLQAELPGWDFDAVSDKARPTGTAILAASTSMAPTPRRPTSTPPSTTRSYSPT